LGDNYFPAWDPGDRIVYTGNEYYSHFEIWSMKPDGTDRKQLAATTFDYESPSVATDGRIVFTGFPVGNQFDEIYVMNADGSGLTRLTRNRVSDGDPRWSPDGRQIVFDSGRSGLYDIWVMNADGTHPRRVTRFPNQYACCPSWRPGSSG